MWQPLPAAELPPGASPGQTLFVLAGCNSTSAAAGENGASAGCPAGGPFPLGGRSTGVSGSKSNVARLAFASYGHCMATCNRDFLAPLWTEGWERANASAFAAPPWAFVDAWCASARPSPQAGAAQSSAPLFPLFGDDAASALSPPSPRVLCWLPRPCAAFSLSSHRDQRARISGAYDRYVDVIMSEALRSGASLSASTPLQVTALPRDPVSGVTLQRSYLAKARVLARKWPNFFFSSYVRGEGHRERLCTLGPPHLHVPSPPLRRPRRPAAAPYWSL